MATADFVIEKEDLEDIKKGLDMTMTEALRGDIVAQLLVIVHMDITRIVAEMLLGYESKTITKMDILKFTKVALDAVSKRVAANIATLSAKTKAASH